MVVIPRRYPSMRTPASTVARIDLDQTYRVSLRGMRTEEAFHLASLLEGHPVFAPIARAIFDAIERSDYDADAVALMATAGEDDQSLGVAA